MDHKIYIRLLEGTLTYVPVQAMLLNDGLYQILGNPYLQLEDDITSIWEFFPGDVVRCEKKGEYLVAHELVSQPSEKRKMHQLIFSIVFFQGELPLVELEKFRDVINALCQSTDIPQKEHPAVKKWLSLQN